MNTDTDALPAHLTVTKTDRGFSRLPTIPSVYGGHVAAYESSGASDAYLWLKVRDESDRNGPATESHAHLTVEDALRVADQLVHLVANHYQFQRPNVLAGQLAPGATEVREQIDEMLTILAEADEDGDES